jgi:uncharacterized repeat protein (TIGR03803 family)
VFLTVSLLLAVAWARKETVLHTFCTDGEPCTDGAQPFAGLVFDREGNLYATTYTGGRYGGTIFKVTTSGTETVLYDFCSQDNCTDGQFPYAGLVFDAEGNAYGTTSWGGDSSCNLPYGCGVVFKLTPSGTETVLHTFTGTPDGQFPMAGLIFDESGNLYGTTYEGGISGSGAVFKVTPSGEETILYSFGSQCYCPELYYPYAGLVLDKKGNLYGTTRYGGVFEFFCHYGCGEVFKVDPSGKETVLHTFCHSPVERCVDGAIPFAGLAPDKKGNFYGTTTSGAYGPGAVFKITPSGKETILYNFKDGHSGDGVLPEAGLVFDAKGNLYGTTERGGVYNAGTVFKITPSGKETVLYSFTGGTDGANPVSGLLLDKKGTLYGTTSAGGSDGTCNAPYGCGVVFKLTP